MIAIDNRMDFIFVVLLIVDNDNLKKPTCWITISWQILVCAWKDSNLHVVRHQILSLARLPIPPQAHKSSKAVQIYKKLCFPQHFLKWKCLCREKSLCLCYFVLMSKIDAGRANSWKITFFIVWKRANSWCARIFLLNLHPIIKSSTDLACKKIFQLMI